LRLPPDEAGLKPSDVQKPLEKIFGELTVLAGLSMGRERLKLYFTNRRILAAHMGKRGGTAAATTFFGALGSVIEPLFRRTRTGDKGSQPSPGEILRWHRDNFQVPYSEIVALSLDVGEFKTTITMVTQTDKLRFDLPGKLPEVLSRELKTMLGDRMTSKKAAG
jgi:hypothetical protein